MQRPGVSRGRSPGTTRWVSDAPIGDRSTGELHLLLEQQAVPDPVEILGYLLCQQEVSPWSASLRISETPYDRLILDPPTDNAPGQASRVS